jgi:hypothetical protein
MHSLALSPCAGDATCRLARTALLLVVLASRAVAWGPLFHYRAACSVPASVAANTTALFLGADSPDAFYFGASPFLAGAAPACTPDLARLHDPLFAGFQLQLALKEAAAAAREAALYGDSFDAVSFAAGFGSHCLSDMVGFDFPRGYFNAKPAALVGAAVDWLYTWPLMVAVDAAVVTNFSTCRPGDGPLPTMLPSGGISAAGAAFMARATAAYRVQNPAFPAVNASTLAACSAGWAQHVQSVTAVALSTPAAAARAVAVVYDPYGSTTEQEALAALAMQADCSAAAVSVWQSAIVAGQSPTQAAEAAYAETAQLYKSGQCAPTGRTNL